MKSRAITFLAGLAAVTAGVLAPGTPAAAAAAQPFGLTWHNGTTEGTYITYQMPFEVGRNYTVTGTVASAAASAGECYFVRTDYSFDSPTACGTSSVPFTLEFGPVDYSHPTPTMWLCRAEPFSCSPGLPLPR